MFGRRNKRAVHGELLYFNIILYLLLYDVRIEMCTHYSRIISVTQSVVNVEN